MSSTVTRKGRVKESPEERRKLFMACLGCGLLLAVWSAVIEAIVFLLETLEGDPTGPLWLDAVIPAAGLVGGGCLLYALTWLFTKRRR